MSGSLQARDTEISKLSSWRWTGREGLGTCATCWVLLGTTRWLVTDVNRPTTRIVSLSEEDRLEMLVGLEMLPAGVYMLLCYTTVDQVSEAGSGICRE